jgi:hypothetical protein
VCVSFQTQLRPAIAMMSASTLAKKYRACVVALSLFPARGLSGVLVYIIQISSLQCANTITKASSAPCMPPHYGARQAVSYFRSRHAYYALVCVNTLMFVAAASAASFKTKRFIRLHPHPHLAVLCMI